MHYVKDHKLMLVTIAAGIAALTWMLFRLYQAPGEVGGQDLISGFAGVLIPPLVLAGLVSLFKNFQSNRVRYAIFLFCFVLSLLGVTR